MVIDCGDVQQVLVNLTLTDNNSNVTTCETYVTVFDEFGYCCPDSLLVSNNPFNSGVYDAAQYFVASGKPILTPESVRFEALDSLVMRFGFEVQQGAVFETIRRGCR